MWILEIKSKTQSGIFRAHLSPPQSCIYGQEPQVKKKKKINNILFELF